MSCLMKCDNCKKNVGYIDIDYGEIEFILCVECRKKEHNKNLGGAKCLLTEQETKQMEYKIDENHSITYGCIFCSVVPMTKKQFLEHFETHHTFDKIKLRNEKEKLYCCFCLRSKRNNLRSLKQHLSERHYEEYKTIRLLEDNNMYLMDRYG